jgi:hypothetical protein
MMEKVNNVQTQIAPVPYSLVKALDAELIECAYKRSMKMMADI